MGNPNHRFPRVPEHQISLALDAGFSAAPAVLPELRDEIAAAWGLPLGERVEVGLRDGGSTIAGKLELLRAPAYPWDAREPLRLAIAGLVFSSREIERWTKI